MGDIGANMELTAHPAGAFILAHEEDEEYNTKIPRKDNHREDEDDDVEAQNEVEKKNLLSSSHDDDDDDDDGQEIKKMKMKKKKNTNSKKNLWRMWAMLYPERYRLALGFAFLTVSSLTQIFIPHYRTYKSSLSHNTLCYTCMHDYDYDESEYMEKTDTVVVRVLYIYILLLFCAFRVVYQSAA